MKDNTNIYLYCTAFVIAIITWLLYKFILPQPVTPSLVAASSAPSGSTSSALAQQSPGLSATVSLTSQENSIVAQRIVHDEDCSYYGILRHPPHMISPEGVDKRVDLSGCLVHGIVPFRLTPANNYESLLQKKIILPNGENMTSTQPDIIVMNRVERARIFARLFSKTGTSVGKPPNRGAVIVVNIHHSDVSCVNLQKALVLLGTYYNLFVVVDASGLFPAIMNGQKQQEIIKNIRCDLLQKNQTSEPDIKCIYKLNSQILPPHRIVFSSTSTGRVAFVRQLQGVELVIDRDEYVAKELQRFGHRVLLYPNIQNNDGISALGKFLIQ